jgi:hypothetical protein
MLLHLLWLGLAGFGFGAFFQRSLTAQFDPAFVVDADAFHPSHVADFGYVFGAFYPEIGQLGNMHESVLPGNTSTNAPEFFYRRERRGKKGEGGKKGGGKKGQI